MEVPLLCDMQGGRELLPFMWDRMPAGMGPRELVVQLRQRGAGPEVAEEAQVTTAARGRQRWWEGRAEGAAIVWQGR